MSNKRQVGEAVDIARTLVRGDVPVGPPLPALARIARSFAVTEFDVPDDSDSDGYLFQYGKVSWLPEPTFVLSVARQLEVVDADGGHEFYAQVQFEYRYALDAELKTVVSHSEWWFPGGDTSFYSWLDSVSGSPIGNVLLGKEPREFLVWEDRA